MTSRPKAPWFVFLAIAAGLLTGRADAQEVQGPGTRLVPGQEATPYLHYRHPVSTHVQVAGSWDRWTARTPMHREGQRWVLDVRPLRLPFGRHEYKFLPNGSWEPGDNRVLYVNKEHLLERPSDLIVQALIEAPDVINVQFKHAITGTQNIRVQLEPPVPLKGWRFEDEAGEHLTRGYTVSDGNVTFILDENTYGLSLPAHTRVAVAGTFNAWDGSGNQLRWQLRDPEDDGTWKLTTPLDGLRSAAGGQGLLFKFVVNGNRWLAPPADAPNATPDGRGNVNLTLDPAGGGPSVLTVTTREDLDLSMSYVVAIDGLEEQPVRRMASPGRVLDGFFSEKVLGATLNREQQATTYRVFAPRASSVHLCIFDTPYHAVREPRFAWLDPRERYPMWKDPADGVWELSLLGLDIGAHYAFQVEGPHGDGEGFHRDAVVGDPYAVAAAHAENNSIVLDRSATNRWFGGWTDQDWRRPAAQDLVIYETHVRDLTQHDSSGVPADLRGTYAGVVASEGTGTGLDHLQDLGINAIELLPVCEFNNGPGGHNWGYTTVYYFAPEASYGRDPLRGSQYYEFKSMVNELHRRGFAVILDVVYNHVGSPNIFSLLDRKYYFRLNPDYSYSNFSGVGNDVRSEAPMMRRLIVDNILYWMKEHHIDGFRFDLAELIDMETLMAVRDAARKVDPNVILISEPWSFRGEHKQQLKGTGWSAWNNDFRYAAKDFVRGRGDRDWLAKAIFGSQETWAADPLQPVNYVESHDDMALADELSSAPGHDGRNPTVLDARRNRLAATIVFTSLGIPMIAEGQEFMRSKHGVSNTYDRGDALNALRWDERDRPHAKETLAYYRGLIRMRRSPQGAAFRVAQRPAPDYYRWIRPANARALGYIVNARGRHPGAGFVVLLNGDEQPVEFSVPMPEGTWRVVSDGTVVDPRGLPERPVVTGPQTARIKVPGLRSLIMMHDIER